MTDAPTTPMTEAEMHRAEIDLYEIDSDAAFEAKYKVSRDVMYRRLYPDTFHGKNKVVNGEDC